jgi:hypothetical protein
MLCVALFSRFYHLIIYWVKNGLLDMLLECINSNYYYDALIFYTYARRCLGFKSLMLPFCVAKNSMNTHKGVHYDSNPVLLGLPPLCVLCYWVYHPCV